MKCSNCPFDDFNSIETDCGTEYLTSECPLKQNEITFKDGQCGCRLTYKKIVEGLRKLGFDI